MCQEFTGERSGRDTSCPLAGLLVPIEWGDVASDQADGFAGSDFDEPGATDLDDDRGYGHGV